MSPHTVNNFVSDLVLMAQAVEELPKVKAELEQAKAMGDAYIKMVQERDADLEQSRSYAATLEQKVRDTEVAKDAAETMFLEADERTSRALDFIKATFGNAGTLIQALEPVKAEVKAESASPLPDATSQSAIAPTISEYSSVNESVQGQSETDPTPALSTSIGSIAETGGAISSNDAPLSNPIAMESHSTSWAGPASTDTSPTTKPYEGKHYKDMPQYINYHDWIAGGGTDHNYYY